MFVVKYFNRGIEETALATIILNIPSTSIEIFDKYEKVSLEPCQVMQFLRIEIYLVNMTLGLSQVKKDKIVQQVSISTDNVISHNKGVDSAYWAVNSKSQ